MSFIYRDFLSPSRWRWNSASKLYHRFDGIWDKEIVDGIEVYSSRLYYWTSSTGLRSDLKFKRFINALGVEYEQLQNQKYKGVNIIGANISGSVISASWMDLSVIGTLTNWKYYTLANVPSAYINNFAKNSDGTLVVDIYGYVRLPTIARSLTAKIQTVTSTYVHSYAYPYPSYEFPMVGNDEICSYDSYMLSNTRRCVNSTVGFSYGLIMNIVGNTFGYSGDNFVGKFTFLDTQFKAWFTISGGYTVLNVSANEVVISNTLKIGYNGSDPSLKTFTYPFNGTNIIFTIADIGFYDSDYIWYDNPQITVTINNDSGTTYTGSSRISALKDLQAYSNLLTDSLVFKYAWYGVPSVVLG